MAPVASISIPPALAVSCNASAAVPADANLNSCVPPPVTAICKSFPKEFTVKLLSSAASRLNAAVASRVIAAPLMSTVPVVVTSTSASLPDILTPPAPERVNAPSLVVKFEAAPESIVTPPVPALTSTKTEFNSISVVVVVALPNLISAATAALPIKISLLSATSIVISPSASISIFATL